MTTKKAYANAQLCLELGNMPTKKAYANAQLRLELGNMTTNEVIRYAQTLPQLTPLEGAMLRKLLIAANKIRAKF